jgi:hypothetical protein
MIRGVMRILKNKQYRVYSEPYRLNIVGVRSASTVSNRFDDWLLVFYKNPGLGWTSFSFPITTDPGTYWLKNPMNVDGTAILKQGQYVDAYRLGQHRGLYKALVQAKPVTVIRDYDRNAYLDFLNGLERTGYFGINIHRADNSGESKAVNKWSAGCQVFKKAQDFSKFIALCEKHALHYGNRFTYTLIDQRALTRQRRRLLMYGLGTSALALGGLMWYTINKQ